MSMAMTDEQRSLRDTARRFLNSVTPLERVREVMDTPAAFDAELWRRMSTDLGAAGLAVPEEFGGAGLGFQEVSHLAEEAGRALAPSALLGTAGLAVPALNAGTEDARAALLPRIADGSAVASMAWLAPGERWHSTATAATATAGHEWTVTGAFSPVLDGAAATVLLVLAEAPGGPTMLAVETGSPGVRIEPLPALDQTRGLARVDLADTPATLVSAPGAGRGLLGEALAHADAVLAAEMVGGAQACLDMSVEYAKVREQFGRPIGSFQAIKHKCAEMLVEIEGARAMARYAAWCADEAPRELEPAAAVAKATAAEAYFRAAGDNLQIHGGIGVTWEHDAHLYFKRAKASLMLFGDVGDYRRRIADLIGI
ncbi:acyl-CoA dehydrogenase family protein [Actinomadura sp. WMMB 499]|uniref:acyl-CoA dehydrogenase family protein n=1 Tax=Actinomadura sp. WMMB 499 TaxID=1219491 RepID=UPI0012440297|nr:acyl-CoA dehydrogenase family protein [Actinomadura sp. WMMB 499]QFG21623.1 acyl-CoA dehydrogenase [Actinomadura sp. WMMB 499]